jgi:hypothetical protein
MNRLKAISLGYGVPCDDFTAVVHSVFAHALNLSLLSNRQIITLVVKSEPDLPQGIRLDTPEGFTFEGLAVSKCTVCKNGIFYLEDDQLIVDLHTAKRWKCNLQVLSINFYDPIEYKSWQCAVNWINQKHGISQGGSLGFQYAVVCKINDLSRELIKHTQQLNEISVEQTIEKIIGLGPGLTPAGDDYLVGYIAGLWSTAGMEIRHIQFLRYIGNAVERYSCWTNDISQTYLYHAVHGQVSSRLTDLAGSISRGECDHRLYEVIEASIRSGHISGLMATKGLLEGMMAWNKNRF